MKAEDFIIENDYKDVVFKVEGDGTWKHPSDVLEEYAKLYHEEELKKINGSIHNLIELGAKVYHKDIYDGKELMEIVGIRKTQVELEGDYSGGTHAVCQKDWLSIEGIIFPPKKVCPEKINGSCPHHNLHCNFPDCEK